MVAIRTILGQRFRANRAFELVELDRLPEHVHSRLACESAALANACALIPRSDNGITAKILGAAAAGLVRGLAVAGRLPDSATERDAVGNEAIARLVLDGALEIEHEGRLVSGPAAHAAVFDTAIRSAASGPLAALSRRAIRYGQSLLVSDVQELSRRLYGFGTLPRSARWDRHLDTAADVVDVLGLCKEGAARRVLAKDYEAFTHASWLSWTRVPERALQHATLRYKLYVSPRPEALVACFPTLVAAFAEHGVRSFKVGRGALGLLRPDKLVAYFDDKPQLHEVAESLARRLAGCAPQGVPFTAPASDDGLLSWGIDPPPAEHLAETQFRESWRYWVANRLASDLMHARAVDVGSEPRAVEPWQFALDRLRLEGVDPDTWLPVEVA